MANVEEPIRKMGYGRPPSEDVQTPSNISVEGIPRTKIVTR